MINQPLTGKFPNAGIVFTVCCEPYLQSEYGPDFMSDSPVKLLERLLHGQKKTEDEEVVIVSQVLASEATLGYEDMFNTQARLSDLPAILNLKGNQG